MAKNTVATKPTTIDEARYIVSKLKRDLEPSQQKLVERLHALVSKECEAHDTSLFGVRGSTPAEEARSVLAFLFNEHPLLQLESRWAAEYFSCSVTCVHLYVGSVHNALSSDPDGTGAQKLKNICNEIGIGLEELLA